MTRTLILALAFAAALTPLLWAPSANAGCGIGWSTRGLQCSDAQTQSELLERLARESKPHAMRPLKTILEEEYGGDIDAHWRRFQKLAQQGGEVQIKGSCESACTLVTAHIPKQRLCFYDMTTLRFHKARNANGTPSRYATQWMVENYPADIREWIVTMGGVEKMPVRGYWSLYSSQLWDMGYRRCVPDAD